MEQGKARHDVDVVQAAARALAEAMCAGGLRREAQARDWAVGSFGRFEIVEKSVTGRLRISRCKPGPGLHIMQFIIICCINP
jgi:hypothetical protein